MVDVKRIEELKKKLQKTLGMSNEALEVFWHDKNGLFHDKSPDDMTKNESDFRRLELVVKFSCNHLLKSHQPGAEINPPL